MKTVFTVEVIVFLTTSQVKANCLMYVVLGNTINLLTSAIHIRAQGLHYGNGFNNWHSMDRKQDLHGEPTEFVNIAMTDACVPNLTRDDGSLHRANESTSLEHGLQSHVLKHNVCKNANYTNI